MVKGGPNIVDSIQYLNLILELNLIQEKGSAIYSAIQIVR